MNLRRRVKDLLHSLLHRTGYELYKRPYLPKGADAFLSLQAHWPDWRPARIFDVGANVGQTVQRLRPLFPAARIDCFEPVPTALEQLRRATGGDANVFVHPIGLSDQPGEAFIHLHPNLEQCSITPGLLAELDGNSPRQRIALDTLDAFCARQNTSRIDLLKIDVEGHELAVLAGARRLLAAGAIDFIVAETGLGPRHPRFTPLHEFGAALEPHGFWLVGVYEQFGYRFNQSAEFCNALFARESFLEKSSAGEPPRAS